MIWVGMGGGELAQKQEDKDPTDNNCNLRFSTCF